MKTTLLLSLVLAIPALAGPSAKEVVAPAQPPCLFTWFAGGSIGYLTELEEPMYNVHLGTDTCWNIGGWNVALFAELGYAEKDDDWSGREFPNSTFDAISGPVLEDGASFGLGEVEDILSAIANLGPFDTGYDLDIMPITLNVKFERPLTGALNAYFGGGLGVAKVDFTADTGGYFPSKFSDDDWVFTAQIFAGLNYNVTQNFEVYGGARWIYLDDASFSDNGVGGDLELDDDFLFELGGRVNF